MVFTEDEKNKLSVFGNITLDRKQLETLLSRSISENDWRRYQNKPIKKHKKSSTSKLKTKLKLIAKQEAVTALKEKIKTDPEIQSIRDERYKKLHKSVFKDAADVAYTKLHDKSPPEPNLYGKAFSNLNTIMMITLLLNLETIKVKNLTQPYRIGK